MPIKFRCEFCQQLLGISRSRAAATVDCPQCGRSLKVPGSAVVPAGAESPAKKANADSGFDGDLMSALSELTMLGQGEESEPPKTSGSTTKSRPFDDSSLIMHGKDVPGEQKLARRKTAAASGEPSGSAAGPVSSDHDLTSLESAEALQDLASWADDQPAVAKPASASAGISTDLLTEMRQASHPGSWLATTLATLLLVVISASAGWWLSKSGVLDSWLVEAGFEVGQPVGGDESGGESPAGEAPGHIPTAIMVDPDKWVISVSGQVVYLDESSLPQPDGKASVYLLPSIREGNLKVHARSFQRGPTNADRRFSEAALQALGGMRVEADDDGRFEVGTATQSATYQLIVVSQNRERPDSVLADSSVTNALMPWFDSTVHILGQRSVTMKTVTESEKDVTITVSE